MMRELFLAIAAAAGPTSARPCPSPTRSLAPCPIRTFAVLFICTGNSARSIFAERSCATSAGTASGLFGRHQAAFRTEPLRRRHCCEKGHDVSGLRAKNVAEFQGPDAPALDFVFTVCDRAANEDCPPWPVSPSRATGALPDPVKAEGTDAQKALAFQGAYGALRNRILAFTALPMASLDRIVIAKAVDDIGRTGETGMTVYALNGLGRIGKLALRPLLERGANRVDQRRGGRCGHACASAGVRHRARALGRRDLRR